MSKKDKLIEIIKGRGEISRNQTLEMYYTRLAALINSLKKEKGWEFETRDTGHDYVYMLKSRLTLFS